MPYGEADVVAGLFTERLGRVAALARGARRTGRQSAMPLEPMHTLAVVLDERPSADLCVLRHARIAVARPRLIADLDRMLAAGRALRWLRAASPAHTPEPALWSATVDLLGRLEAGEGEPDVELAATGLRLLGALGWGLDLDRCVVCGRACDPGRAALVDAARGGIVCRACGGGRVRVEGVVRERLRAAAAGRPGALLRGDAPLARDLVERALAAHAGVPPGRPPGRGGQ